MLEGGKAGRCLVRCKAQLDLVAGPLLVGFGPAGVRLHPPPPESVPGLGSSGGEANWEEEEKRGGTGDRSRHPPLPNNK